MDNQIVTPPPRQQTGFSVKQTLGIMAAAMVITAAVTIMIIKFFLFPAPFKPVVLSEKEEQHLTRKLTAFEGFSSSSAKQEQSPTTGSLTPEPYSEDHNARKIDFTERELNAMVAKNTDLADKVAIDLADDMISVKILIPLDPDFPMLGGKTFKAKAGAELAYREGRPVVKLRGVSLMGVPMPNAWLGGLKNIDLVSEFGGDEGFWQAFADGVESIGVREGFLHVVLKP